MNLPQCTGSDHLKGKQAEISVLEDLRNVRIWFLLLVLNLFCQGVEPFEVKGHTNALIVDGIVGHGDRKKDVKNLYQTIRDEDSGREIDWMRFDLGEIEIWVQK
jgi:hypothetical protein